MSERMADERLEAIRRTIETGSTEVGWQYAMPEMLVEIDRLRQREQEAYARETVLRETLNLLVRLVQYERHAAYDQKATAYDDVSFALRKANAALSVSPSNTVQRTQVVLETARHVVTTTTTARMARSSSGTTSVLYGKPSATSTKADSRQGPCRSS